MHLRLNLAQWLSMLLFAVTLLAAGSVDPEEWYRRSLPSPVALPLIPVVTAQEAPDSQVTPPDITAPSVYAISMENGQTLVAKNADAINPPASTTKLLTALVARQTYALNDVVTIPAVTFPDDRQPFRAGQRYQVKTLLAALLISSNNTAAYALASAHPAGYDSFVQHMNELAAELGLDSSHFMNPAGFDDAKHYSSARDLALLFRAAVRDPIIAELLSSQSYSTEIDEIPQHFYTTHALLGVDPRVKAGKTGTTDEAKQVLITLLNSGQHPYVLVVLGSNDRYNETLRLADWVDQRYTWQIIEPKQLLPAKADKEKL